MGSSKLQNHQCFGSKNSLPAIFETSFQWDVGVGGDQVDVVVGVSEVWVHQTVVEEEGEGLGLGVVDVVGQTPHQPLVVVVGVAEDEEDDHDP